jgi:hypothetical protein
MILQSILKLNKTKQQDNQENQIMLNRTTQQFSVNATQLLEMF